MTRPPPPARARLALPAFVAGAVVGLGLLFGVARAQNPYPDEVIVSSRPLDLRYTLRVERNLVELRAVVRDSKGKVVDNLHEGDFELFDNGKKQEVSSFSVLRSGSRRAEAVETPSVEPPPQGSAQTRARAPTRRYVLLYFDDLHLSEEQLTFLRQAAENFLETAAAPRTFFAISTSSGHDGLGFTSDPQKLHRVIFAIRPRSQLSVDPNDCPPITPYQAFLIVNGDPMALNLAIEQCRACGCGGSRTQGGPEANQPGRPAVLDSGAPRIVVAIVTQIWELVRQESDRSFEGLESGVSWLALAPGERVLVLISPGFISHAPEVEIRLNELIDLALRANVVINSLDATGLAPLSSDSARVAHPIYVRGADNLNAYVQTMELGDIAQHAETLEAPADGTGGTVFRNSNDLAAGLQQLAGPPEVAYLLSYSPNNLKPNGAFHKLAVRVAGPGHHTVEARKGYFAPAKEASRQSGPDEVLRREIFGHGEQADFPATLSTEATRGYEVVATLTVRIKVDINRLPFRQQQGLNLERLNFKTVLLDSNGGLVAGKQGTMELRLKDETRRKLASTGAVAETFLEAPAGSYRLREVITESERGLTTLIEQPVNIP